MRIPYGEGGKDVDIDYPCEVVLPRVPVVGNTAEVMEYALANPFGQEGFPGFLSDAERLLVVVNDATRPSATPMVLNHIRDQLERHRNVNFLVATGSHRAPTEAEMARIFGDLRADWRDRIFVHDARNDDDMEYMGTTSRGTEVRVNKMLREAGNVLVIGNVKPHYFAGFSGGRKAFMPGVASLRTIEMNHSHAVEGSAMPMALEGNPVHEDMVECLSLLNDVNIFSIQTVLTMEHEIFAVAAGDIERSHHAAVEKAREIYGLPIREMGNVVITVVPYPMDIHLYQAQHAIENGRLALEGEGILLVVSKCWDGVGDDAFLRAFDNVDGDDGVKRVADRDYVLGDHKVLRMMRMLEEVRVWAVTDLDDDVVRRARMMPFKDIETALHTAVSTLRADGREPVIKMLPFGGLTTPIIG